ncbi:P-loop containing nucleoside triphosphate hydrolase protein [Parathielavia appendiculata]|uniref:P-loop containing nucleoside triphosphate hydrolase protein n=1 Tax=Parathielavia appendiculata TaxID=2587402 RepID=A0AAN6TXN4_9PEZI|nr:P-loop containing nucleoside triphosphate hydrolase protein [Parathielavia appendiculata]
MRLDDAGETGFASCPWPIWQTDDFTRCFQQDYLKVLLPLAVVSLSILQLAAQNIVRAVWLKNGRGYERIGGGPTTLSPHTHTELPRDEEPVSESEDEEDLTIGGGRLALYKTTTRGSIVQADVPPAQTLSVLVEELAVAGLVAVNAIALATGAYGREWGGIAAIAGLTVWIYVLVLTSLRLFLGNTPWRVPRIWNHTAAIYGFQWLFIVVVFRSVLIHPSSQLTQTLVIVEFALTSLLFGMAISTRKGNKTILLEWEDGIEPARENLASLFSHYTFSWVDAIVLSGWKEPLTIKRVWNLLPKDKAAAVLASYRQFRKTSSLAFHLVRYFKGLLLAQALWAVGAGVLTFAPTLLLRAILQYVEDPAMAPRNVLWLYVILLPVTDILRSVCDGQALWIGRKICINIRAILVGEIYAKALRRKAAAGKDTTLGAAADKKKDFDAEGAKGGIIAKTKRLLGLEKRSKDNQTGRDRATVGADKKDMTGESDEQANLGTIINLMSVDSFKVSEVTSYLHFLIAAAPTQLLVSIILLYQVMGLSAIPGFVVMALLLPVNIAFGKGFNSSQKRIMAATDKRIHTTNEILQNIRIIKYFAWEHRFATIVDEKRRAELKALRRRFMIWAAAVAVWNTVPILITFFSFLIYTIVEKKPLYPSVAFTAISLFMLLRYPLDQLGDMIAHVQESQVSIDRIEEFLSEEETEKFAQLGIDNVDENGNRVIGFRNATFVWGSKSTVAEDGSMAFRLLDLDVDFKIGKLNVITGPTGSGKTSMLMALLGEMTIMKGRVYLPGGRSREDVHPDPETGLAETCAYVAQQAWLVNASIKDNILFSAPFDEQRYRDVIVACALERDLEILENGDETLVGEKGITLSGGQKQRISLARAVYSNSKHLLMDDCLSAVDSHTAQWIFNNCIMGPLMRHRTCILVSHNIPLCVPPADYVVTMANGRVTGKGTPQELIATGNLPEDAAVQRSAPGSAHISRVPSRVPSSVGEESGDTLVNEADGSQQKTRDEAAKKKGIKQQDAMEEHKAVGAVQWPVMKLYLRSMGSWWFWVIACLVFGAQQLSGVASSLWVKEWSNQYAAEETVKIEFNMKSQTYSVQTLSPTYFALIANHAQGNTTIISAAQAHEVNVTYYLTVLAIIGIAGAVAALVRDLWIFFGSLTASWKLHNRLMAAVAGARFKFFDITPMGQIMNRFSKDLEAVDQEVAPIAIGVMSCALGIVVTVVLIAYITPGFLIAGIFITLAYVFLGQFYLHASRDLKRLESVERSPLFQQFGETLTGVTTIRAYGDERRFIRDNLARINTQLRPFIYLWAANRWLAFRTDLLGDFVAFFAGVFVILSLGKIDAGSAGISLSYAIGFADNILWLVRLYAMNEQNMNSVERIKEYLEVEQEAAAIVEKNRAPENWPAKGTVEFINYTTRYRKELEPVLRNLTFRIEAHEKVGIVGRTGAGKSSLTLAIFRALEADEGKILIDDIDISQIGLRDLREAITIVPQEPTLFTGTIRTNLDPFDLYTDEQIFNALRRVHLIQPDELTAATNPPMALLPEATTAADNVAAIQSQDQHGQQQQQQSRPPSVTNKNIFLDLSSPVSESGNNLSQGQRQLLCLARAMLKKPSVLVMDEATASIDYATDSAIQETIRELTSTIITIAHRLQTIVDYDKVLVLDKGRIVEYGHPWELMKKGGGVFRGMCEMSGDYAALAAAAKKAWKGKQLVDVDEEEREGGGNGGEQSGSGSGNRTAATNEGS